MAHYCDAQALERAVTGGKTNSGNETGKNNNNNAKPPTKVNARKTMLTITADEDCNMMLDNKDFGSLNKGETKTISVYYATYKLTATSKFSGDQYVANINVKGNTSTIMIDLNGVRLKREQQTKTALGSKNGSLTGGSNIKPGSTSEGAVNTMSKKDSAKNAETAIINILLSNMVPITAGSFIMGNNLGDNDEGPEHSVTILQVQFGKYEVTQQQWETIMGTNPSINQGCKECPVENISWNEIDSFLIKINQVSSRKFRLPTEAEWEYIARTGGEFEDLKQKAWYNANSEKKTHPVGLKLPNAFGIYDLSGNVSEWCSDWYGLKYYKRKARENPPGPDSGKEKVLRGGSYENSEGTLRPSYRSKQNPASKNGTIGLRLVMEIK